MSDMEESKVARNTSLSLSAVIGIVTWALVTFVPSFNKGLPVELSTGLPVAVTLIAHYLGYNLAAAKLAKKNTV